VKPYAKQNPLVRMMHVSPFVLSRPVIFEDAKPSTHEENDLEEILHLYEDKRSSKPSIEYEPLSAGPKYVVLDHDRVLTMILHVEPLEMENP
jgi:hypothetical protein